MSEMQLCSDALASRARKLAKETGVTHHVIDVSQGGGKGFQRIAPDPVNYTADGQQGTITLLYTAKAAETP